MIQDQIPTTHETFVIGFDKDGYKQALKDLL